MKIILASNSPRRRELLTRDGYQFDVIPSNCEEVIEESISPLENVKRLAYLKAYDVAKTHVDSLVIGADTIVVFDDVIYGKPKDYQDARRMLKNLAGNTHEVMTGVAIIYQDKIVNEVVVSKVTFKNITDEDIEEYIQTQEPLDKAGAYAIQGIGRKYIETYSGDFDNIVGLPMEFINGVLKKMTQ